MMKPDHFTFAGLMLSVINEYYFPIAMQRWENSYNNIKNCTFEGVIFKLYFKDKTARLILHNIKLI